ncbi:MAG: penicillin-binding transpeptidase domain-containing protein [Lachnospiraceae bacterium]|nr:penicillin-binding transpeptidase domain-containing protein [Lachnospiraceae bacterium]
MNSSKNSIKRIFVLIILMFLLVIFYMLKIVVADSKTMITNSYNPRINTTDNSIKRGSIKDIDGTVMAYSEKNGDTYVRKYVDGTYSAHVLGYTGAGKAGIEANQNFTLQKLDNETFQRINSFLTGSEVEGNSVVLTVDHYLQKIGTDLLRTNNGAVVVVEVKTGRVLCMTSKPNYDPQTVAENWDILRQSEDSPILNRATQGVYTPGSTFKIVTAIAAMRNIPDFDSFTYTCTGEESFQDKVIHCNKNKAHGEVNLTSAFAQSCNCYFSELGKKIGPQKLRETADSLGFNQSFSFDLNTSKSTVLIEGNSTESELVETSIGQGRTTVTPLFMASLTAAIANDGVMMQPYIVDHIENYSGKTVSTNLPKTVGTIISSSEAKNLKEMMVEVINRGTGFNASSEYFQVAGKTGTAENPNGTDHLWFVGFAPAEEPEYAVAVVLENGDGSMNAGVIARKMLYNAINREENQ